MSFELRRGDQIIFGVDTSGSMQTPDAACGGQTRWAWMQETLKAYIAAANPFDPDGLSVHFFASAVKASKNVASLDQIQKAISSVTIGGSTATEKVIQSAYQEHVDSGSKSTYLLIFTDGDATDQNAVKNTIIDITNKVSNPTEFRILFLPIGTIDSSLQAFLDFLDNSLTGAKYDIVAVTNPGDLDFQSAIDKAIANTAAA